MKEVEYKKLWKALKRIYGDRELKSFTICSKPNKEYPITINGLTIKKCMDYVKNKLGAK